MPPIEVFYVLINLTMTILTAISGIRFRISFFDMSRAHFYADAAHQLDVELRAEDVNPGDAEPMCGRMPRAIYGFQDASHEWQKDYANHMSSFNYEFGRACRALFPSPWARFEWVGAW